MRALPSELVKAPHFQQRTVISLLDIHLTRRLARELGVEVTAEEGEAWLARQARLARFAALDAAGRRSLLAEFGLGGADLDEIGRDSALAEKLSVSLAPSPDEETLWTAYRLEREQITLHFVAVPNTPSSRTLDAFVAAHGAEIEAYYKDHPSEFAVPPSRKVRALRRTLTRGALSDEVAAVRAQLDGLRLRAMGGEDFEALARASSQAPEAASGGSMGYVVKRQMPEAFQVAVGEISEVHRDKEGLYILKVEEELPAHQQPLTTPTRREIAARILRDKGPDPDAEADARKIAALWAAQGSSPAEPSAAFKAFLTQETLRTGRTFPFSVEAEDDRFIPGIGSAPPVMIAARALSPQKPISAPIFHQGQLYVLALVHKGEATRTGFAAERAEYEARWIKSQRQRALPERLDAIKRAEEVFIDLRPIRARYGVLQKGP